MFTEPDLGKGLPD